MSRILVAIPPLRVSDRFIDNPAFAFLPALMWAAAAAVRHDVRVENALLSNTPLLRTPEGWLLGGEPSSFWNRVASASADHVVVAWSSYHRRSDPAAHDLPDSSHPAWRRPAYLAEFWHAESRYEPRAHQALRPDLPFVSQSFADADTTLAAALGVDRTPGDVPLPAAWLGAASLRAMALLDPIVRTGAADGATEAFSPGQPPRSEGRFFPVMTSTGCSYRCLFCHKPGQAGTWRARPLAAVRSELQALSRSGARVVFILDPIANYEPAHFEAVLSALESSRLSAVFPNGLALAHLTPALLERLRRVCSDLVVSVESGSKRTLTTLRKPVELGHAEHTLSAARQLGFHCSAHFIVGAPGESSNDIAQTLHLATHLFDRYGVVPSLQRYVPPAVTDGGSFDGAASPAAWAGDSSSPVDVDTAALWVREYARSKATPKIIINVSYACNNHCSFCAVADRPRLHGLLDEQLRLMREAQGQGIRHLDIDGGEPTLYPGLAQLLQTASDLGFERVNVTTNGRRLAYPDFAQKLAKHKNLELCVSMHGPDAATHDALTQVSGSFHQTLTGLYNAARAGLDVALNVTAVAGNASRLFDTVALAASCGVKRVSIQRYTPFGTPDPAFEPPIEQVIDQIARIRAELPNLSLSLVNFCACEVGPHARFAVGDQAKSVRTMQFVDLRELPLASWLAGKRRHVGACAACHLREVCPGKWVLDQPPTQSTDELIDFTPGLSCKTRCKFCAVPAAGAMTELDTQAASQMLERLSPRRPGHLRFSGGEPTDRDDLPELIRRAKALGYRHISVQSHGLRFDDDAYLAALADAGLEQIRLSVFAGDDDGYMAVAGVHAGFSRVSAAIRHGLARLGQDGVGLDILALRPLLPRLAETTERLLSMGVGDIMLWLPAYEGRAAAPGGQDLVPTLTEAKQPFQSALALEDQHPGARVRSIYAPLCILGPYRERSFDVRRAPVLVVNPSAVLPMSRCAVDLGMYPPKCIACSVRENCLGLRPSYVARHGDDEVDPVA